LLNSSRIELTCPHFKKCALSGALTLHIGIIDRTSLSLLKPSMQGKTIVRSETQQKLRFLGGLNNLSRYGTTGYPYEIRQTFSALRAAMG
jgi:hypothetical protein